MRLFKGKPLKQMPIVTARTAGQHPFSLLGEYVPLAEAQRGLYRSIREAVPVVDAAVVKLVRLTGGVTAVCADKNAERQLQHFLETVPTGMGQMGINSFLDCYLDSMIVCGRAVGEIVTRGNRDIAAVICADVEDLAVRMGKTPTDFEVYRLNAGGEPVKIANQELVLFAPLAPEAANPLGVSMLRSMPFMTDILLKIYRTIGENWERAGNVRYSVIYKPKGDVIDRAYAQDRAQQMAKEWSSAMRETRNGSVKDFVSVGDVEIKVIGADGEILDSEVPVRQILEQIIARTGIPPFLLGLSWSSTERMSSQQADIMTSEITAIRRSLTPVVSRICDMWLKMHGYNCGFEIVWDDINLQDEGEEAHAELYRAQADYYRAETERLRQEMETKNGDN